MANILLVDPSDTARRSMRGILACAEHKLACASSAAEAWDLIHDNVSTDLVFTELKLTGGVDGLAFIQRLKSDRLLKLLPIVIYTGSGDRQAVRRGLDLRVQNFLVKPYHDDDIYEEIAKAEANPWRNRFFEEERSFCRMMGYTAEQVHLMLDAVRTAVEAALATADEAIANRDNVALSHALSPLVEKAETAGAWGIVECLNGTTEAIQQDRWGSVPAALTCLRLACRMISRHLDPTRWQDAFLQDTSTTSEAETRELARWQTAAASGSLPVIEQDALFRQIDALPGCPVVNSAAASFQMAANGHPSCINPLMDLVERDPGLSTQMLIAANQVHPPGEGENPIEDPRLAVGLLGETRLESHSRRLLLAEERHLALLAGHGWPQYLIFQTAVGRVAHYTCQYLEFFSMAPQARTAGFLHDIGTLTLLHLHPMGYRALVAHAHEQQISLATAARRFVGATPGEIGARLGTRLGLPRPYTNVMRWLGSPAEAGDDATLVAIVTLARDLCLHNHVCCTAEPTLEGPPPLEETPEWAVISERLYPSFNLRRFELQVHAQCQQMRHEALHHGSIPFTAPLAPALSESE